MKGAGDIGTAATNPRADGLSAGAGAGAGTTTGSAWTERARRFSGARIGGMTKEHN